MSDPRLKVHATVEMPLEWADTVRVLDTYEIRVAGEVVASGLVSSAHASATGVKLGLTAPLPRGR